MAQQKSLQILLLEEFKKIQRKRNNYSQRAYAKKLGLSSGALSGIMNGKRRITKAYAKKLLDRLDIPPEQLNAILAKYDTWDDQPLNNKPLRNLSADEFHLISDGLHYALLSLMETTDFKNDIYWISQKLRTSSKRINTALERLIRLGLVNKKNGKYSSSGQHCETTDDIPNSTIRQSHAETLQQALESLENDEVTTRDFTSLTLAVNPEHLSKAKKLIREFRVKMENLLESGNKRAVYKFSIQLFPISEFKIEGDQNA